MRIFDGLWQRARRSAVIWSWALTGLRLAAGLVLLPLLLRKLSTADLGMYYVFLFLVRFLPIIDFGFSVSVGRSVAYAMGGATELKAHGVAEPTGEGAPNYPLLWRMLFTCQKLYGLLALAAFAVLGGIGTWVVSRTVEQTDNPTFTWCAWGVALLASTLEIYLSWWNVFLRGANQVVRAARFLVLGYSLQITIAAVLLLGGGGLISLPVGILIGGLVQRTLSRRACFDLLGQAPSGGKATDWELLKVLWPNSWRIGVQHMGGFAMASIPGLLFGIQFGLERFAPFGVTQQIIMICLGMSGVWMQVKWPVAGQLQARRAFGALQRMLWTRLLLQCVTYVGLTTAAIVLGPWVLDIIGSGKELLPVTLFVLLGVTGFFDMQYTFWTTVISTGNRIPFLRSSLVWNAGTVANYLVLTRVFGVEHLALVVSQLLAGFWFCYWYWPYAGVRSLGTTPLRFALRRFQDGSPREEKRGGDTAIEQER